MPSLPMYEDIADWLVAEGMGTKSTDLFGGNLPPAPDDLAALFEHPGQEPEFAMGRLVVDVMTLQVIVRDTKSTEARTRAFAIRDKLVQFNYRTVAQRTLGGKIYFGIWPKSPPFSIGMDENKRAQWSCNYSVWKEP